MRETTLVLGTDRRLRFIHQAVLDAWAHGACGACGSRREVEREAPTRRTSTWAREPGTARPGSGRARPRPAVPPA